MDKTSFNVKIFDWDYLHLTAQTKETYFSNVVVEIELTDLQKSGGAGAPTTPPGTTGLYIEKDAENNHSKN